MCPGGKTILLDPCKKEEELASTAGGATMLASYMPSLQQLTHLSQTGAVNGAVMQEVQALLFVLLSLP